MSSHRRPADQPRQKPGRRPVPLRERLVGAAFGVVVLVPLYAVPAVRDLPGVDYWLPVTCAFTGILLHGAVMALRARRS